MICVNPSVGAVHDDQTVSSSPAGSPGSRVAPTFDACTPISVPLSTRRSAKLSFAGGAAPNAKLANSPAEAATTRLRIAAGRPANRTLRFSADVHDCVIVQLIFELAFHLYIRILP